MADVASTGAGDVSQGTLTSQDTPPQEPTSIDVADETLIRVKGSDKPVKFGEHVKGFQKQFTQASQRAAALERELTQAKAKLTEAEREKSQAAPGKQDDVYAALRALPYLNGEDAAALMQHISSSIQQRDMVLLAALKEIQTMRQVMGQLYDTHQSGTFESKINKWLTEMGYPPEAASLAKEIYLAYEGDDLDEEFPRIFKERWEQVEGIIEGRKQAKLREKRQGAFLPGKGGDTKPGKGLQLDPKLNSREVADQLWESMQGGPET